VYEIHHVESAVLACPCSEYRFACGGNICRAFPPNRSFLETAPFHVTTVCTTVNGTADRASALRLLLVAALLTPILHGNARLLLNRLRAVSQFSWLYVPDSWASNVATCIRIVEYPAAFTSNGLLRYSVYTSAPNSRG
jgi:hypothetical protein